MDVEQYLEVCRVTGTEPDPEKMPVRPEDLLEDTRLALEITSMLPDRWDGMSGSHQGKDLTILPYLLDLYDVSNKLETVRLITSIINEVSIITNDKISKKVNKHGK